MTDCKRRIIFSNLLIISIASSFLSTALSTALPPIITEFGLNADSGQWINSIYSLVMGIIMPFSAFLITRFKTKRLYLSVIFLMILGLILSSVSKTFSIMMTGRVLQAVSSGITTAMAQVVILSIYPKEKRGSAMGWYGLVLGAAPIIAPTIGGVFIDTVGWRMIFVFTLILMVIGFIFTLFTFDNVLENEKKKFDLYSFILSALTFGGVTLGLGNAIRMDALFFVPLIIGIIAGVIFTRRQLSLSSPFLDLTVFRKRNFTLSVVISVFFYMCMMGSSILIPLYLQSVLGYSATISGLTTLPGSLVMAVSNPFTGKLYDKFGMRKLSIFGALSVILSYFGMSMCSIETSLIFVALMHGVKCLGVEFMMMPFVTWGITSVEKEKTAHANALLNALRSVGGAIGQTIFVSIMTGVSLHNSGVMGVRAAFAVMLILSLLQLVISLVFIKKEKRD